MNVSDFTTYCIENIDTSFVCIKTKYLFPEQLGNKYFEYKKNDTVSFKGFILTSEEQTVILRLNNDSEETLSVAEFSEYFASLDAPQCALAGH